MEFELNFIKKIKADYEKYIANNESIYKSTIQYMKYLNYRNKITKRMEHIELKIQDFHNDSNNYKNRLVVHKIRDSIEKLSAEAMDLNDDLDFINQKLVLMDNDLIIFKRVEDFKNEIHRLNIKINFIENQMLSSYEII